MSRIVLRSSLTVASVVVALCLSGCVPQGGQVEPTTSSPLPAPSVSPHPSDSPSPSASPVEEPTPVSIPCNDVVSAQTMYNFNPNFGLLANFTPDPGSFAEQALAIEGVACRWVNQTSGATIDVSIAQPGPTALADAKDAASSGAPVSGIGDAAFFSQSGAPGVVQAFAGPFWVTATSVYFAAPGDASSIMADAVAAVR